MVSKMKTRQNPENTVGLMSLAEYVLHLLAMQNVLHGILHLQCYDAWRSFVDTGGGGERGGGGVYSIQCPSVL